MKNFELLNRQLDAITDGIAHPIANLSNASALLWQHIPRINWAGFYLLEGDILVLGPFQGKPACIEIPVGKGVCGTAVSEGATQVVADVHRFPCHIACDSASNSEIVVPMWKDGKIIGVMDIDSPELNRFSKEDRIGLEAFVQILQTRL